MAGTRHLQVAIKTAWDAGVAGAFTALWSTADKSRYESALEDTEAAQGMPFPYCVFTALSGTTVGRMSGAAGDAESVNRELREVPVHFRIHTRTRDDDGRMAKEIGADLADSIMQVYGGALKAGSGAELTTMGEGAHVRTQYQTDYGLPEGDDNWLWIVSYIFTVDMPVATGS